MAERNCLLTSYPTDCNKSCFNCDCGGAEATKDMYVSIHNVQRVCAITGGAADTDEGEYIAGVIRNNLENMVIEAQPVKRGRWEYEDTIGGMKHYHCTNCDNGSACIADENQILWWEFCPRCGARMDLKDGDTNG